MSYHDRNTNTSTNNQRNISQTNTNIPTNNQRNISQTNENATPSAQYKNMKKCKCVNSNGFYFSTAFNTSCEDHCKDGVEITQQDIDSTLTSNLVIKSNVNSFQYSIDSNVYKQVVGRNIGIKKLTITPKNHYIISASDFFITDFPDHIEEVTFHDTLDYITPTNKVDVVIKFKDEFLMPKNFININLAINGSAKVSGRSLKLTSVVEKDDYVAEQNVDNPTFKKEIEVIDNKEYITYTKNGDPNNEEIIFTKIFTAPENYYFSEEPSFILNVANKSNYIILTSKELNNDKNVISKTFIVKALFNERNQITNNDSISFKARTTYHVSKVNDVGELIKEVAAPVKRIYSLDIGRPVSERGGLQHYAVRGTPGTSFKLAIKSSILDSDNNIRTYDHETGVFKAGGVGPSATVPREKIGSPFGIFKGAIKVPVSSEVDNLSIQLVAGNDVIAPPQQELLDRILNTQTFDYTTQSSRVDTSATITFSVKTSGTHAALSSAVLTGVGQIAPGTAENIIIGPGREGTADDQPYNIKWAIDRSADANEAVQLCRQPLFTYDATETLYLAWDGSNNEHHDADPDKSHTVGDVEILSDWDCSDQKGNSYSIELSARIEEGIFEKTSAVDDGRGTDTVIVKKILYLTGRIYDVEFGHGDINPQLNIENFASIRQYV